MTLVICKDLISKTQEAYSGAKPAFYLPLQEQGVSVNILKKNLLIL